MRKLTNLLLVVLLIGYVAPIFAQSSTEGKEFWVGLTMAIRPPGDGDGEASPYMAISTKETTTVTFASPAFPTEAFSVNIGGFEWKKIDIPQKWWYPTGVGKPSKVKEHADEVNNYGIYVKADKNISVFAILRAGAGMDASNILPITALQTEYILQDYIPHAKDGGLDKDAPYTTMATILATEDNTEITVKPKGTLLKAATPKLVNNKITLNRGQTYYLMAENSGTDLNCLSGTEITSDKKIAVFQGVPCTFVPHDVGNRDCLFEQAMPVDYWGTEFIATRSFAKGANIIRITASNDNQPTTIFVNGTNVGTIDRGDTYEIELASTDSANMNNSNKKTRVSNLRLKGEYVHIKTTCPVAVYSYDCGKSYTDKSKTETNPDGKQEGDPSSVWIAPMEQSIDQITFGACGTKADGGNQTKYHYMDIVVETDSKDQTVLYSYLDGAPIDIKSSFKEVEKTKYSYARVYLAEADDQKNAVFTVANPSGLVAHVYGNGESESYSYSVGSSAITQGIRIDNVKYDAGLLVNDRKFCCDQEIKFDANIGTDVIESIVWDFDDGIVGQPSTRTDTTHTYSIPGWYSVTANLFGHQVCTDDSELPLGSATVTIHVVRPDTIKHVVTDACVAWDYVGPDTYWDTVPYGCDSIVMTKYITRRNSKPYEYYETATGSFTLGGITFTHSTDTTWTTKNRVGCDSTITCHITILKCLDMQMSDQPDKQTICAGETLEVAYSYDTDGKPGKATFVINGTTYPLIISATEDNGRKVGTFVLPTDKLAPGKYVGKVYVEDITPDCQNPYESPDLNITITYPEDVLAVKFNNVLAVYKKGYGGNTNYEFSYYQFYRNGVALTTMTEDNIYHLGSDVTFEKGDIVYVMLCDNEGNCLPSCPITIQTVDDYHIDSENVPIRKTMVNKRIYITVDGRTYDCYGQRVE